MLLVACEAWANDVGSKATNIVEVLEECEVSKRPTDATAPTKIQSKLSRRAVANFKRRVNSEKPTLIKNLGEWITSVMCSSIRKSSSG